MKKEERTEEMQSSEEQVLCGTVPESRDRVALQQGACAKPVSMRTAWYVSASHTASSLPAYLPLSLSLSVSLSTCQPVFSFCLSICLCLWELTNTLKCIFLHLYICSRVCLLPVCVSVCVVVGVVNRFDKQLLESRLDVYKLVDW